MPVIQSEIDVHGEAFAQNREAMLAAIAAFREVEQKVLELRLGFGGEPLSYADVARTLGVTGNRVRRAERRALDRLRDVCPQGARERLAG